MDKTTRQKLVILIKELRSINCPNLTIREKNRAIRGNVRAYKTSLISLNGKV